MRSVDCVVAAGGVCDIATVAASKRPARFICTLHARGLDEFQGDGPVVAVAGRVIGLGARSISITPVKYRQPRPMNSWSFSICSTLGFTRLSKTPFLLTMTVTGSLKSTI